MSRGIIVEKNFIHSFQANSSTGGYLNGIVSTDNNGKERIQNNMIRLGIDTAGNTTNNITIHGISIKLDSSVITNNSVYIGGTGNYESAALHIREVTSCRQTAKYVITFSPIHVQPLLQLSLIIMLLNMKEASFLQMSLTIIFIMQLAQEVTSLF